MKPSNKLYGVTHDPVTGEPRVMEPRTTKLGIGLPKGRAIHAYIDTEGKWVVAVGSGRDSKRERVATQRDAQVLYRRLYRDAPERKFPERIPYFTFTRLSPTGEMEPDWDVIADHGPMPTEIDIFFLVDEPFETAYQMWSATEKRCWGDGRVAMRVISMAETAEDHAAAAAAADRGEKYFPLQSCWLAGCKYSKSQENRPSLCRPMGRLTFQLVRSPRLGGSVTFVTSGYRSISQIFSTVDIIRRGAGGFISGIPLKLVLRPYRIQHNGRNATQYAVSLEFRAASALALKQDLIQEAVRFRMAGAEPLRQLEAGAPPTSAPELPDLPAAAIEAEFVSDLRPDDEAHDDALPDADPDDGESMDDEDPIPPGMDPALFTGPTGDLAHAWDDDESDDESAEPSAPVAPRATAHDINRFRHLCRQRGVSDALVAEYLGRMGFESLEEVTAAALPDMYRWADSWKGDGQRSLL